MYFSGYLRYFKIGVNISQKALLVSHPAALGLILGVPKNFSLDNVNRTHLVLASGNLVLEKKECEPKGRISRGVYVVAFEGKLRDSRFIE